MSRNIGIPPKPLPTFEKFAAQLSFTIGQMFMLTFGEKIRAVVKNAIRFRPTRGRSTPQL